MSDNAFLGVKQIFHSNIYIYIFIMKFCWVFSQEYLWVITTGPEILLLIVGDNHTQVSLEYCEVSQMTGFWCQ